MLIGAWGIDSVDGDKSKDLDSPLSLLQEVEIMIMKRIKKKSSFKENYIR